MIAPTNLNAYPATDVGYGRQRTLVQPGIGAVVLMAWAICLGPSPAGGQLRIVSYNTANAHSGATSPRPGLGLILESIGDEVVGAIAKPLDVLLLQEQDATTTTTQEIVEVLNGIYGPGTYDRGNRNGDTWGSGRPTIVYNTQTVELLDEHAFGTLSGNGAVRQTLRYQLRPIGYDSAADFTIYNDHYKASNSVQDANRRDVQARTIRANSDAMGEGAHLIYAGDFNIYGATEPMYQTLLSSGPGQAFDPVNRPGSWHDRSSFRDLHTQSPADGTVGGLVPGGMDDRFDFQLVSGEFLDSRGLSYIDGSYHTFGNNGSHALNGAINVAGNTAQSASVLNALARTSDHLPVVADYQIPAMMQVTVPEVPARVIEGAIAPLRITVANVANVVAESGADRLDYSLGVSGSLKGGADGSDLALGGGNQHTLLLDTSQPGAHSGTIVANSSSPAAANAHFAQVADFNVLHHARGSFESSSLLSHVTVDFGFVPPGSGVQTQHVSLFNLAGEVGETANLDLDSVTRLLFDDAIDTDLSRVFGLVPGDDVDFEVHYDASISPSASSFWQLALSDEDLPGEQTGMTMGMLVLGQRALPGDANLDGLVDVDDFNIWNEVRFQVGTSWETGDFNGDGVSDGLDFSIWNQNRSVNAPSIHVPEPSGGWLVMGVIPVALVGRRCRRTDAL